MARASFRIPDRLDERVEEKVEDSDYMNKSDYYRQLIREDLEEGDG